MTVVWIFALSAQAQILFSNGAGAVGNNSSDSFSADADFYRSEAGNVFSDTVTGTGNFIQFAGLYAPYPVSSDNFTLSLYATASGAPSTLLASTGITGLTRSALGTTSDGIPIYQFSGYLSTPISLTAGTSYYLGFSDSDSSAGFALDPAVVQTAAEAEYYHTSAGFSAGTSANLAFTVSEVVSAPEPSSSALLLGSLSALLVLMRRRHTSR
jgi:hypothetical protein